MRPGLPRDPRQGQRDVEELDVLHAGPRTVAAGPGHLPEDEVVLRGT
ncbi:hypothetical protein ACWGQ4_31695 [Streptomyces sp. NPDC055721]